MIIARLRYPSGPCSWSIGNDGTNTRVLHKLFGGRVAYATPDQRRSRDWMLSQLRANGSDLAFPQSPGRAAWQEQGRSSSRDRRALDGRETGNGSTLATGEWVSSQGLPGALLLSGLHCAIVTNPFSNRHRARSHLAPPASSRTRACRGRRYGYRVGYPAFLASPRRGLATIS
jgi:hypothetical protein